ncbi:GTPase HflX [Oenococcus alcoholitolerans]|uniref:GTPase HflX n=1 Tax=Oenococcus alcoholitolerans TaxID=931074 RepID=A0ABR4XST1_9LACO|nr:GTP-binding protein [Oenococcus alcoholitolerans]
MTTKINETKQAAVKAVIIAVENQQNEEIFDYKIEETKHLAEANKIKIVGSLNQKINRINSATYFGKGKIQQLKELVASSDADLVISQDDLTATQIRNIEKELSGDVHVVDRTAVILDIFAARAKTKIAKLQVRLAQKQYQLPRLHTSLAKELDQQAGAGGASFTSRGSGETKLELNRRTLEAQISQIKKELNDLLEAASIQSKQRQRSGLRRVAFVGYTNAGKSSWMNQMIKHFSDKVASNADKQVFEKNMLFATLDSTVRSIRLRNNRRFLLSDTVGFVSDLPHDLVASFKSTLDEAKNADLLVQIVDISDPNYHAMIDTTKETLAEIGADQIPMIMIFNKADLAGIEYPQQEGENLIASSFDERSVEEFAKVIDQKLFADFKKVRLLLPFDQGGLLNRLSKENDILEQRFTEAGTEIMVELAPEQLQRYKSFLKA